MPLIWVNQMRRQINCNAITLQLTSVLVLADIYAHSYSSVFMTLDHFQSVFFSLFNQSQEQWVPLQKEMSTSSKWLPHKYEIRTEYNNAETGFLSQTCHSTNTYMRLSNDFIYNYITWAPLISLDERALQWKIIKCWFLIVPQKRLKLCHYGMGHHHKRKYRCKFYNTLAIYKKY